MTDDRLPNVLTVEEAAKVLRIGRTAAYQLAQRFEATAGAEGLPVIRVGHLLRVPVPELERRLGGPLRSASPSPVAMIRSSEEPLSSPVAGSCSNGEAGAALDDEHAAASPEAQSNASSVAGRTIGSGQPKDRVPSSRRRARGRARSRDQLSLFVTEPPARDNSSSSLHRRTRP